jgi:hypothetical protein
VLDDVDHGHEIIALGGEVKGINGAEVDGEAIGAALGSGALRDFDAFDLAAELVAGLGHEGTGIAAHIQEAGAVGGGTGEKSAQEFAISEAVAIGIGSAAGLEVGVLGVVGGIMEVGEDLA